jgi:hypothetical protein
MKLSSILYASVVALLALVLLAEGAFARASCPAGSKEVTTRNGTSMCVATGPMAVDTARIKCPKGWEHIPGGCCYRPQGGCP